MLLVHSIVLIVLQQATQPEIPAPPELSRGAQAFYLTIVAIGMIVLAAFVVRAIAQPRRLRLEDTPPRRNYLGFLHVGALLVANVLVGALMLQGAAGLMRQPIDKELEPPAQTMLLGGAATNLVMLALVLAVGQAAFVHGLARGMGFTARRWIADSLRGLAAALAVFPIATGLSWISELLVPKAYQQLHPLLQFVQTGHGQWGWLLLGVFLAVVLAPVVEESFFRGIIQSALRRRLGGPWPAILLSSFIFAAIHVDWARVRGFEVLLPLLALAVALGYLYERTGRLWPSIVTHAVFNAVNVAAAAWGT